MEARKAAMEEAQAKAKAELQAREQKKADEEGEEVELRERLDPGLKAWSEDFGKKKNVSCSVFGVVVCCYCCSPSISPRSIQIR